ncbi:hypothetical protein [Nocardioides hwasunensis]|uniref:Uncharacterized protein n=1 Tax=Nocardioides hwasunensis TaxID=397258 RepID=A0ABR8MFZ9_9ACTN|nr:hypothetical protein [Nocardioides hwasunensis]MBD3915005.1 hypothetical protein [Nocardioides hwasunensis]
MRALPPLVAWSVGAVIGIAAGTGLALSVQDWQEEREAADVQRRAEVFGQVDDVPAPVDAVRDLLDQDTLVAVDPLLADRVPEDDLQRAEEVLSGSRVPARIAYLDYPDGNEVGYTPSGAAAQWRAAVGQEGHYVVLWSNGGTDSDAVGLEPHYLDARSQGQPGPALVRIAEEMATWEAEPLPTEPAEPSDFDYWGGVGGGLAAAALMGALGIAPLFLLLRWYVGSRRREVS